MKTYSVRLPITGYVVLEVEAIDENDAVEKALETDWQVEDIEECEATRYVTQGNVSNALLNEADATLEDEE